MGRNKVSRFSIISNPERIKIIEVIERTEPSISQLEEASGINRGTLKHHLSILERAGYIKREREEKIQGKPVKLFITSEGTQVIGAFRNIPGLSNFLEEVKTDLKEKIGGKNETP